jgi:anti-anti-sigma factor
MGRQAVVVLPDHIDVSNAGRISEQLLSVINRGATELIADMSATVSCDHAGADAVARAYQRAAANGTRLRLVVTAPIVRRVLSASGLDRLIPVYPSLEAATAAAAVVPLAPRRPGAPPDGRARRDSSGPRRKQRHGGPGTGAITQAVLWKLIDALADGVTLTDDDGTLVLVNRRVEAMFGYEHGELAGVSVESLLPQDLRTTHRKHRAGYTQVPRARPMGTGARLIGLRKDGSTFPVEVSLSPVPTATAHLTLAVIRDVTDVRPRNDLAELARAAVAVREAHRHQELLDTIVNSLFDVGISLQAAIDQPHHVARRRISEALQHLDDTIHQIRDHVFSTRGETSPPEDGAQDR